MRMKKVLVMTASPRRNGSTDKMAEAFMAGAQEAGHEVFKFEAAFKHIGGCTGCNSCWSGGHACIHEDDFRELEPLLESCDVLVISTPLYWYSLPAQIKGAVDKLYAYGGSGGPRPLTIKESYFFVCGELAERDEYQPMLEIYRMMAEYLHWENRGIIQTGGMERSGAIEASGVLEQARDMGRNA